MVGVILYTFLEWLNFYLAYRCVFGIRFTKKRWPYVMVIGSACVIQVIVLYLVDDTWRDVIIISMGLLGAVILSESKKWKTLLLYPMAFFIPSIINILGGYGVSFLLGLELLEFNNSDSLLLLCEFTGIIILLVCGKLRKNEEVQLTVGQYIIMLLGVVCFFILIVFSQGLLYENFNFSSQMKNLTATASLLIAIFFMGLSILQQITWKKAMQYRMDNEKYQIYLEGQEEHIRMLIVEDEKRRKLRHDMNAHMLALGTMVEKEEWEMLREYLGHMEKSMEETSVNKYTSISAVDAIVDEWHRNALEQDVKWSWEGRMTKADKVSVFELCTIFSNLLSNAVEAVGKIEEERRIEVKISNYQGQIVISVGNSCGVISGIQSKFVTSKEDKVFHGLGLKNVQEIVKNHEGNIDFDIKTGWFQVDIVL